MIHIQVCILYITHIYVYINVLCQGIQLKAASLSLLFFLHKQSETEREREKKKTNKQQTLSRCPFPQSCPDAGPWMIMAIMRSPTHCRVSVPHRAIRLGVITEWRHTLLPTSPPALLSPATSRLPSTRFAGYVTISSILYSVWTSPSQSAAPVICAKWSDATSQRRPVGIRVQGLDLRSQGRIKELSKARAARRVCTTASCSARGQN